MIYLDTSALVKLAHPERETDALVRWLSDRPHAPLVASALVEVELVRALRIAESSDLVHVPTVLAGLDLVEIDGVVRGNAAAIGPTSVRSLDAIHLATALELATELEAFVTYDKRLGDAATVAGLTWEAPRE